MGKGQQQQQQRQGERDGGKEVVCSLPLPPGIITPPEGQGGLEGVLPKGERGGAEEGELAAPPASAPSALAGRGAALA